MIANVMKNIFLRILCVFVAGCGLVAGDGLRVVRPAAEEKDWSKECEAIIQSYRNELKPASDAKIILLFTAVKLGLSESVDRDGAALHEFAFVYSEVSNGKESATRKITVLVRSPYEDRRWETEFVSLKEGEKPLTNVLVLKPSIDVVAQISEYAKQVIIGGRLDHIISVICFERGEEQVFGKKLEDDAIRQIFSK